MQSSIAAITFSLLRDYNALIYAQILEFLTGKEAAREMELTKLKLQEAKAFRDKIKQREKDELQQQKQQQLVQKNIAKS